MPSIYLCQSQNFTSSVISLYFFVTLSSCGALVHCYNNSNPERVYADLILTIISLQKRGGTGSNSPALDQHLLAINQLQTKREITDHERIPVPDHTYWPQNHLGSPGVGGVDVSLRCRMSRSCLLREQCDSNCYCLSSKDSAHESAESLPIYAGQVRVNPGGAHCSPIEQFMDMVRRDGSDGTPFGTHYWL